MARYLAHRLAGAVFAIWGVSTVIFIILHVTSDPVNMLLPAEASQADYDAMRARLGLDEPLLKQYGEFLQGLVTLDFGPSFRGRDQAMALVLQRFPASLLLTTSSVLLALIVGLPIGIIAAASWGSWLDQTLSALAFVGRSLPAFWLGVMLIIVFGVNLGWFPTFGMGTWRHLILPTVTLAIYPLSQYALVTRTELLEVLGQDYVRTARAKGARELSVLIRHGLRAALLPVVTIVGLSFAQLLGSAVVTETIFAWPGVGRLTLESISQRDFPVIQASIASIAIVFVAINLLVDVLYSVLDPRIRTS